MRVGGAPADAATFAALSRCCGFVPQDDIVDRQLTAREALTLSARLRLPPGGGDAAATAAADRVISLLGLGGVAHVVLGGGTNAAAAVSGGQLKRVSIGLELVAEPRALFLDEPTSGLVREGMASLRGEAPPLGGWGRVGLLAA